MLCYKKKIILPSCDERDMRYTRKNVAHKYARFDKVSLPLALHFGSIIGMIIRGIRD